MKYGILGTTGLKVSLIGFGGIPIQRCSKEEAVKTISRAQELGVNFIDTARGYTVSESYIGEALKGNRDKWIIASKSMARDRNSMDKDIETTLKNLNTDYIDLYQLHNVRTEEELNKVLDEEGAYRSLERAKEKGLIGHIGITSHSVDALELALDTGKFETIMYPYNIVETQARALFKRASGLGVGVIAMKPLAGGLLQDVLLALKFVLENQDISVAIPGMATVEELEANLKVFDNDMFLSEDEKIKVQKMAEELGSDFCRRCGYCQPCPAGIDMPSIFTFQAYKERYDLADWAEGRYFNLKKTAKDCAKCGECETKCPYNLPIRNMLEKVKEVFGG
ncbi:MAG TPA: aldo/keto reductase [Clostridiaceae bacterium]|nr:aldo/keto reductase [Clostridiaceae bacterium]